MPRRRHRRTQRRPEPKDYVVVTNRGYGNKLKGTKIFFEGRKPSRLNKDGRISFGKHILEALARRFPKFRWIITAETDSIEVKYGIKRVRTSVRLLDRMYQDEWSRKRDIKNDIVRRFFSTVFPGEFSGAATPVYVPGTLAGLLDEAIVPRLSSQDRDALRRFLPGFVATESVGSVNLLKAASEIKTLKELASVLEQELDREHGESWWQEFVKANILLMQQGYIRALDKLNVALGETRYPDFSLVTHDGYLDILEIKRPNTPILIEDTSRGNFYWHPEVAKAISQTENYIEYVSRQADAVRSYLLDTHKLQAKALRPRGIILVGDTRRFEDQKTRDDLRLLAQGLKNITILTYDELLTRLQNYIAVLEEFSKAAEIGSTRSAKPDSRRRSVRRKVAR